MLLNHKSHRLLYFICILCISVLTLYAIFTYQERMLFVDPAWITYHIINTKSLMIQEHRYGSFITQIFPLIGVYLGSSLKTILIVYSFSFYLFYLTAILIIGVKWKQYSWAILLTLYLTLFVSDTYYWPNNEVHQGITWMFLWIALYLHRLGTHNFFSLLFCWIFLVLAISSHLLVCVPLVFLWGYTHAFFDIKKLLKDKIFVFFTLSILILVIGRYQLSDAGWYDPVKLEGVKNLNLYSLLQTFKSGQATSFTQLLLVNYWLAIPIFLISVSWLIYSRRYFLLFWMLAFAIGYFMLICITFPEAFDRSLRFYMESEWAALSIIIATPFVFWLKTHPKAPIYLTLLLTIRLIYIFNSYDYFHLRLTHLRTTLYHMKDKNVNKALIQKEFQNLKSSILWTGACLLKVYYYHK